MRLADSAQPGSICKIYKRAAEVDQSLSSLTGLPNGAKEEMVEQWSSRWKQHSPLHAAAYCLDPEFAFNDQGLPALLDDKKAELRTGLIQWLRKVFHKPEDIPKRAEALTEHAHFLAKKGLFSEPEIQMTATTVTPHVFWDQNGVELPSLRTAAMRLCAQISSSSVTERTWSNYDYVHNKRRNKLSAAKSEKLVMLYGYLRLEQSSKLSRSGDDVIPWRWKQQDETLDEIDADSDVLDEDDDAFVIPDLRTESVDDADTHSN